MGQAYTRVTILMVLAGCSIESTLHEYNPDAQDTGTVPEDDTHAESVDTIDTAVDTGVVEDEYHEPPEESATATPVSEAEFQDDCSGYAYPAFGVTGPQYILVAQGDEVKLKIRLHSKNECGSIKVHQLYFDLYPLVDYYSYYGYTGTWMWDVIESALPSFLKADGHTLPSVVPCPIEECPWGQPTYAWQDDTVTWPPTHSPMSAIEIAAEDYADFEFTWIASEFLQPGEFAVLHLHSYEWTDVDSGQRLRVDYTLDLTAGMTIEVEQ